MLHVSYRPVPPQEILETQGTGESDGIALVVAGDYLKQAERESRLLLFLAQGELGWVRVSMPRGSSARWGGGPYPACSGSDRGSPPGAELFAGDP
jgi:hypothetical protein